MRKVKTAAIQMQCSTELQENLEKAGITKRFYNTDLDQVTQEIASYMK